MSNAIFPIDQLTRADITTILKDLKSLFGLEVKLNAKTEDLKLALIDSFKNLECLDYVIANYSPVDRFNAELTLIAKQLGLKLTLKKCLSVLMPRIDPTPSPVSTQDRVKSVKPGSKVNALPRKIEKVKDLSAVSLQDQFASIGFKDQNGELVLTDVAQIILTTLWELDPVEYSGLAPNGHVRQNGYYSPALITVKPVTQQVESGKLDQDGNKIYRDVPIYRVNHRTVIESNKVLRNSSRNGVSDRKLDLLPLIADNEVLIDNIESVQWFVTSPKETRPDQRKTASTLRKNTVKTKLSWSTRYVRTVLDPSVSYGIEVSLPVSMDTLDPDNCRKVKYRLVLENHGKVSLYQDGMLSQVIGRWHSSFDHTTGELEVNYNLSKDNVRLKSWLNPISEGLDRLVKSQGRAAKSNLSLTMLNNLCQDHRKQYGSKWSLAKYRSFKSKARKAVYSLYYHNPDKDHPSYREPNPRSPLPYDIQRLCFALDSRKDLTESERAEYNKALIGYALYANLIGGSKKRNDTFKDRRY
jgi:hypothetical protein